jgi:hypothetical protein
MYQSDTVVTVLKQLNDTYFLPAIQREFVWKPTQVTRLFDSIMQDYPIGSFLFWRLERDSRDTWDAYNFLTDFKQGGTHNRQADLVGILNPVLVLDGQQRLTALLIGLRGRLTMRVKTNLPLEDPAAWEDQYLYLDLLRDPADAPDEKTGARYRFKFLSKAKAARNTAGQYWFRVGRILDCISEDELYRLKRAESEAVASHLGGVSPIQAAAVDRNLDLLYRRIWREPSLSYHLERLQDYDRVLEIFARANAGGTKLDKSDLLLSMVTAKWDHMNAREEIYRLVDRINKELSHHNDINKDFVLKCALVLCDRPVAYTVDNFTVANMQIIAGKWPQIKQAIETGFDLVNSLGVDRTNLTSLNAVIPIIYYLMGHRDLKIGGSTPFDITNAQAMRKWLALALLAQLFGGHSDSMLQKTRSVIKAESAHSRDFPLTPIAAELGFAPERLTGVIVSHVLKQTYSRPLTFLALTLLYDETDWASRQHTQDHIFPRSLFSESGLKAAGIRPSENGRYSAASESIANLQLLLSAENMEKSNRPFDAWIRTRDPGFKRRHLIPEDTSLYTLQMFPSFVKAREKLITDRLKQIFLPK